MKKYIVELEPGTWIAPWDGDPGRTLVHSSATRYKRRQDAKAAITRARKYRKFVNARIIEAEG